MRELQPEVRRSSIWHSRFKISHVFALLLATTLVGCSTPKKELKDAPQEFKWARRDIPTQYLALLRAISASDPAGIEAAIQQGADPNRYWCKEKQYGRSGPCEPGQKGIPFLGTVVQSFDYSKSTVAIPVLKKYSHGWGSLDPQETYGYLLDGSYRANLSREEDTSGKKLVGKVLVQEGVNITPEFIEYNSYWKKVWYCRNSKASQSPYLSALSVVQSIAQDAKMSDVFNKGLAKADKACSEQHKYEQAAVESKQRTLEHKAQLNAKLVRQIGQKICRSVEGTFALPVAQSIGQTLYGEAVATRYYVTAFTENSANSKIQLRISSVYRMEGSKLINVETLGGKTVYRTNAVLWEDPNEWEPCD